VKAEPVSPSQVAAPPHARRRGLVPLALLTAVAAISFAASFFKLAAPTHPLAMAAIRLAVAGVVLLPWGIAAYRDGSLRGRRMRGALLAGIAYGAHFGAWVSSLTLTSVAASVTLVTTTPLLLAALSLITGKDRPTRRIWVALAVAAIGVTMIGGYDGLAAPNALVGDALAFLGAVAIALYFVISRAQGDRLPIGGYSCVACLVGAASLFATGLVLGVDMTPASPTALLYIVLAALIPQLIGHSLLTWSLRHANPTQVAMAVVGEPAGAALIAWLWLNESVPAPVAIGCAITLAAVVTATIRRPAAPP